MTVKEFIGTLESSDRLRIIEGGADVYVGYLAAFKPFADHEIDHAVLKTEIRKVIKDAGVLALLDRIIDHNGNMPDGVGIPVGNLTSQLFANIYLDALDQFIKGYTA